MIVMEGLMLVPPERGTIIGRAIWKPRYVVFGTGAPMKSQNDLMAEGKSAVARKALKSSSRKASLVDVTQSEGEEGLHVSIYKAKGDWEYLSQHAMTAFKSCEIRALAHRKQGPSLPTLMLEFKPDPTSDKARKRRSSRTGGLTSKDPWANILLFRTLPEERHNIYDWQAMMKPHLTPESVLESPTTPSAQFNNFSNPFAPRENRRPDTQTRTSDRNVSSYPHAPRERPSAIISPSPSLRSRRSDLSSQASSQHPPMGFTNPHSQGYTTTIPADLPSPASTSYEPQFIEGWTAAQGRSSALSSHTRGSNSIASAAPPPALIASTPPGPRETILDRAFQMRCIPGSERISENDEDDQLSSMARFEALMREVDEKRLKEGLVEDARKKSVTEWHIEEDSEEESDSAEPTIGNDDDSDDADGLELSDDDAGIPTQAQAAVESISGRRTPIPGRRPLSPTPSSPPVPFLNTQAMSAFHGLTSQSPTGLRPRTGTNTSAHKEDRFSRLIPTRSISAAAVPVSRDLSVSTSTSSNLKVTDGKEKRLSSTSVKRLSFTEFARRLSSTSSLLLVQTNASSTSGRSVRTSGEVENDATVDSKPGVKNEKCAWRNSTGVFGNEGGFL